MKILAAFIITLLALTRAQDVVINQKYSLLGCLPAQYFDSTSLQCSTCPANS